MTHSSILRLSAVLILVLASIPWIPELDTTVALNPRDESTEQQRRERSVLPRVGSLPLSFTRMTAEATPSTAFFARTPRAAMRFDSSGVTLNIGKRKLPAPPRRRPHRQKPATKTGAPATLRLEIVGADDSAVTIEPIGETRTRTHILRGNAPEKWRTDLRSYSKLCYRGAWEGIEMQFRGSSDRLKYDLLADAGVDVEELRLRWCGATGGIDDQGQLRLETSAGSFVDERPIAWQETPNGRVSVDSKFVVHETGAEFVEFGFAVGDHDPTLPLTIDPGLIYSTLAGGLADDDLTGVDVDSAGFIYVCGESSSPDFPTTNGTVTTSNDLIVMKIDPSASGSNAIVWSTVIGDANSSRTLHVHSDGRIYVCASTDSTNYPTVRAFSSVKSNPGEACFFVLEPDGSTLYYSTYLGGSRGLDIAVDSAGAAYVTGVASSFSPVQTTIGAFDTTPNGGDAFVAKLDPALTGTGSLLYMTYLGGSRTENNNLTGSGIAVDSAGCAIVTGPTESSDFPVTPGAFQTTKNGPSYLPDVYVTKFDPTGSSLIYSTYIGGDNYDEPFQIAVDAAGNAYTTGVTGSSDFPLAGAFDTTPDLIQWDGFALKLDPTGSALVYSTYLGGSGYDVPLACTIDASGCAYISGYTESFDFPTFEAFQPVHGGGGIFPSDHFVMKIAIDGSRIVWSTYLGGSGDETATHSDVTVRADRVYVVSSTPSTDFPTTPSAIQTTLAGGDDGFLAIFAASNTSTGSPVEVSPEDPTTGAMDVTLTFDQILTSGTTTATSDGAGNPPPTGFKLGSPPTYWEIDTDATFTGSVEVCVDYSAVSYGNENQLKLFHFEGGQWIDVTTSIDTADDVICGLVTSLSPFAIFEAFDAETELRALGDEILALDLSMIHAPNANAALERRGAMSNQAVIAADHAAGGRFGSALNVLDALIAFMDGVAPDWILAGPHRDALVAQAARIRALLVELK